MLTINQLGHVLNMGPGNGKRIKVAATGFVISLTEAENEMSSHILYLICLVTGIVVRNSYGEFDMSQDTPWTACNVHLYSMSLH